MQEIRSYRQFVQHNGLASKARGLVRALVIAAQSSAKGIEKSSDWIRFPYYHHVFGDEKKDFERQLRYLKNFGDFISMDTAHEMISGGEQLSGRYFCVTFDDGFYSCLEHMMEVTDLLNVPVLIYLPTDYIGLDKHHPEEAEKIAHFYPDSPMLVPFLNWDDCRKMLDHNIQFGSHTCSHAHLIKLSEEEVERELKESKQKIEEELGRPCVHFASPWGRSGIDFNPDVLERTARKLGFKTAVTTNRGKEQQGGNPYLIHRDHVLAKWGNYQLRYFFGD